MLDPTRENELLDHIAREDFADEWTDEHEDPYIDHGAPVSLPTSAIRARLLPKSYVGCRSNLNTPKLGY